MCTILLLLRQIVDMKNQVCEYKSPVQSVCPDIPHIKSTHYNVISTYEISYKSNIWNLNIKNVTIVLFELSFKEGGSYNIILQDITSKCHILGTIWHLLQI